MVTTKGYIEKPCLNKPHTHKLPSFLLSLLASLIIYVCGEACGTILCVRFRGQFAQELALLPCGVGGVNRLSGLVARAFPC